MIVHPKAGHRSSNGAYVFAHLLGVSCSVCAPNTMNEAEVEAFALAEHLPPSDAVWRTIDTSTLGLGQPTPHPCNIEPDGRRHWFLVIDK